MTYLYSVLAGLAFLLVGFAYHYIKICIRAKGKEKYEKIDGSTLTKTE